MSTLTFEYRAVDTGGTKRKGTALAANEAEAYRRVTAMGLIPLSLRPAKVGAARKIKLKEVAHFTSQLGVLMGAHVSLSDGLVAIGEQVGVQHGAGRDGPSRGGPEDQPRGQGRFQALRPRSQGKGEQGQERPAEARRDEAPAQPFLDSAPRASRQGEREECSGQREPAVGP